MKTLAAVVSTIVLVSSAGPATAAPARTVAVSGAVATPTSYTTAQLGSLPQVTLPVRGTSRTVTGASLQTVVDQATPILPPGKNTALRFTLTVTGRHHQSTTFALGELDPGFGNHPALLTVRGSTVNLTVPGDRGRSRDVSDVATVQISVSDAGVVDTAPGSVRIVSEHRTVTLSASLLSRLPKVTRTVTFLSGTTPQTHTESGPSLSLVLLSARVLPTPSRAVVAVGSDGYAATVTLAEDYVGGRPLLLSLQEDGAALDRPRLVPDGDVKGGRYVSGVVALYVWSPAVPMS